MKLLHFVQARSLLPWKIREIQKLTITWQLRGFQFRFRFVISVYAGSEGWNKTLLPPVETRNYERTGGVRGRRGRKYEVEGNDWKPGILRHDGGKNEKETNSNADTEARIFRRLRLDNGLSTFLSSPLQRPILPLSTKINPRLIPRCRLHESAPRNVAPLPGRDFLSRRECRKRFVEKLLPAIRNRLHFPVRRPLDDVCGSTARIDHSTALLPSTSSFYDIRIRECVYVYVYAWVDMCVCVCVCKRHNLTANERTFKFTGYVFRVRNGITGGLYRRLCHLRLVGAWSVYRRATRDLQREFRQFNFENASMCLRNIIWKIESR